ncbi:hypothetical protein HX037_05925 [Ignatzschineria indica]|uniref:hypothetical protein n=1 Tax=Ignatzschineria indica TaxID=472583 RepID=UPI002575C135|nr:hypothetical protein [Ignatzschineria indica]MDM1545423.1 hypothetical protein [Ignatzschineria indica]
MKRAKWSAPAVPRFFLRIIDRKISIEKKLNAAGSHYRVLPSILRRQLAIFYRQ